MTTTTAPATPRRITARYIQKMLLEERDAARMNVLHVTETWENDVGASDDLLFAVRRMREAQHRLDAAVGLLR